MSGKHDQVEEYFHRQDKEKIQALKDKMAKEEAAAAAKAQRDLHYLFCGKCGNKMDTQIFKGVEIEVCPACKAVLLDPGELEELVGRDESHGIKTLAEFFNFARRS